MPSKICTLQAFSNQLGTELEGGQLSSIRKFEEDDIGPKSPLTSILRHEDHPGICIVQFYLGTCFYFYFFLLSVWAIKPRTWHMQCKSSRLSCTLSPAVVLPNVIKTDFPTEPLTELPGLV